MHVNAVTDMLSDKNVVFQMSSTLTCPKMIATYILRRSYHNEHIVGFIILIIILTILTLKEPYILGDPNNWEPALLSGIVD